MLVWRHEASRPICEQALALSRAVGAHSPEFRAQAVLGVDLAYLGHGDEGLEHLRLAVRLAEQSGDPGELVFAYCWLTDVLTMLGRLRESIRLASAAVSVIRAYGVAHGTIVYNQVEALIATGEWDEATASAPRHCGPAPPTGPTSVASTAPRSRWAAATSTMRGCIWRPRTRPCVGTSVHRRSMTSSSSISPCGSAAGRMPRRSCATRSRARARERRR
jgi:hypothetical protein